MCNGFLLYKLIRTCRVQLRHHSLNGSSDSVRPNGDLQFLWEYANFNPRQNRYPLNWSTKKLAQLITCTRGPPTQMWYKSTDWGLLAKWVKYNKTYFLFIGPTFFSGSRTGHTCGWIFTHNSSKDVKSCLLGGLNDVLLNFVGKTPKKWNFWGRE